jgi:hypothetical protein
VIDGGKKTALTKEVGRYIIPVQHLLNSSTVTVYMDGLVADPVRDMVIVDTSDTFDGTIRYTIDRAHIFCAGTLYADIDKTGFVLTLLGDYVRSDIEIYVALGDERIYLTKDGSGKYIVPVEIILGADIVTLSIDGLVADPLRGMTIIDASGTYYGNAKYSIDREHSFDGSTLYADIDKTGFAITLMRDYINSDIAIYLLIGDERTLLETDGDGRYVIPLRTLIDADKIALCIEGLVADPIREMTIADPSGMHCGNAKYSIDREHSFDTNGVLYADIDSKGFAIALSEDYKGSDIRIYMILADGRTLLETDGDGRYMIPLMTLLDADIIALCIEGLVADPVREMTIADRSGYYYGIAKYSIDGPHSFDKDGRLSGIIDKTGFAITLMTDYSSSDIEVYMTVGGIATAVGKDGSGKYIVPLETLLASPSVTLFIEGLVADPVRDLVMIDVSEGSDGTVRYATDLEHSFDPDGILFGKIGRTGFAVTPEEGYNVSGISIYMTLGDGRLYIEKDAEGRYIVPLEYILVAETVTLYIDGIMKNIPAADDNDDDKDDDDKIDHKNDGGAIIAADPGGPGMLAFICVFVFIALGAGLTAVNTLRTRSILRLCGKGDTDDKENEQT